MTELLTSATIDTAKIWQVLERARIGLTTLNAQLPQDWEDQLGKALWAALRTSIDQLKSYKYKWHLCICNLQIFRLSTSFVVLDYEKWEYAPYSKVVFFKFLLLN